MDCRMLAATRPSRLRDPRQTCCVVHRGTSDRPVSFTTLRPKMKTRELIIIGGGPPGYTAALYAAGADLRPPLVGGFQWGGQLVDTSDRGNYPGYRRRI